MTEESHILPRIVLPLVIALSGAIASPSRAADEPAAEAPPTQAQAQATDSPPPLSELMGEAPATLSEPPAPQPTSPSQNVTLNLIHRLVQKGVLSQADAEDLIKQSEADAASARKQADGGDGQAAGADDVRVTYIPENVKSQMRNEIREEVMARARSERWAAPNSVPDWTTRIRPFGDFRGRYESIFFQGRHESTVLPVGNDNTGAFPNFNAINTGAPFDVSGSQFSPQLNVDRNRQRDRLRVRFGADVDLGDDFTGGLRLATGDSNSPVSTNQSLGASGGNFSKYAIWLDRAFLKYEPKIFQDADIALLAGRFDNPFLSTEAIWDDDLGFDGLALKGKWKASDSISPFFAIGAFPVFNTDLNFATNNPSKFKSGDKYLYGAQAGVEWKIDKDLTAKFAGAFYDFDNVAGKLSTPFTPLTAQDAGSTDATRPSFAQKGNTYMFLRDIINNASNNNGQSYQYQYYGLATPFRDLALTGRLDYTGYEPLQISLVGEYIQNLAYDGSAIAAKAVNNRLKDGTFVGGDKAWLLNLQVGKPAMEKWGDWLAAIGYRHVESDSVVDGFNDSDFGGGGTNVEGFTLGGAFAVSKNVRLGMRWMSANQIAGPQMKSDILQFDLHAKF
jgi:hypothetical protein